MRMRFLPGHSGEPYIVSPTSAQAQAALRAVRQAFECEPLLLREGGSIPIVTQFKKYLGADTLLLGLALPDDNLHSPNEKFNLQSFALGSRMGVYLWPELASNPTNE
jgi:acetylornithine deacetylase/succinyl-diaminopimelate desuccinylase-like protein